MSQDIQDFDAAQNQLEEAVALLREIGDRWHYANAVNNLANVARGQGFHDEAWELYEESLIINRELGDGWALAYLLEDVGALSSAEGFPIRAVQLVASARSLRDSVGAPLSPKEQEDLDERLKPARAEITDDRQKAAWDAGLAMSLDEALDYALDHPTGAHRLPESQ